MHWHQNENGCCSDIRFFSDLLIIDECFFPKCVVFNVQHAFKGEFTTIKRNAEEFLWTQSEIKRIKYSIGCFEPMVIRLQSK